ncbi:unnamed protein product [Ascophyllum nodosum]
MGKGKCRFGVPPLPSGATKPADHPRPFRYPLRSVKSARILPDETKTDVAMGGAQDDDIPLEDPLKRGTRWSFFCGCFRAQEGIRHQRLATVATSRLVSLKVLLGIRLIWLLLLILGAVWLSLKPSGDGEPPHFVCWPEWSYIVCILYFLMAVVACLRQIKVRPFTPRSSVSGSVESVRRSLVNTATQILLEISVVFETIAVPVTWSTGTKAGEINGQTVVHLVALAAAVTDLLLNRARIEVKHTWAMFAFLVAWAIEQVAWVNSDSSGRACYNVFNAKEASSIYAAVIAPVIVGAVVVAYAVLCAQRDRLTSQFERSDVDFTGPDVEEDATQETTGTVGMPLPTSLRPPPPGRSSVVNPIFAGSGSRMKRKWSNRSATRGIRTDSLTDSRTDNRTSLESNGTEMFPAEDLERGSSLDAHLQSVNRSAKGARGPSLSLSSMADSERVRMEWRGFGGGALAAHSSTGAAYSGAAAWVRPSNADATPTARGQRGGPRRPPSRSLSTSSSSRWPG